MSVGLVWSNLSCVVLLSKSNMNHKYNNIGYDQLLSGIALNQPR